MEETSFHYVEELSGPQSVSLPLPLLLLSIVFAWCPLGALPVRKMHARAARERSRECVFVCVHAFVWNAGTQIGTHTESGRGRERKAVMKREPERAGRTQKACAESEKRAPRTAQALQKSLNVIIKRTRLMMTL